MGNRHTGSFEPREIKPRKESAQSKFNREFIERIVNTSTNCSELNKNIKSANDTIKYNAPYFESYQWAKNNTIQAKKLKKSLEKKKLTLCKQSNKKV